MSRPIDYVREAWELGGEPSDLNPWYAAADPYVDDPDTGFNPQSRGVKYYLEQLSRAQIAISNWRKQRGHEVRFKRFITNKNIQVGLENNTFNFRPQGLYAVSVPSSEFYPGATGVATADYDIFEGCMLVIEGTNYPVIMAQYDATIAGGSIVFTFYEAVSYDITATSYEGTVHMTQFRIKTDGIRYDDGFYAMLPVTMIEILKMYDGPTGARMKRPGDKNSLYIQPPTLGTPDQWYVIGDKLYLNAYLEIPRFFQVEYYRVPSTFVVDATTTQAQVAAMRFEIPEYFHEPLLVWIEWRQARRQQEWDKAFAIKKDLYDLIERMSVENSLDFMRDETYNMYVQFEEN